MPDGVDVPERRTMVRKSTLYGVARGLWVAVVVAAGVLVYTGRAGPYLTLADLPVAPIRAAAGLVALALAGVYAIDRLKVRDWRTTGEAAGLKPRGGGLLGGTPQLVGSVGGRPVRARTVTRSKTVGGDSTTRSRTYTVVEADLQEPASTGLVLLWGDGAASDVALVEESPELSVAELDGSFAAVGPEDVARGIVASRAGNALRSLQSEGSMYVGDVGGLLAEAGGDAADQGLVGLLGDGVADALPGDAATVGTETRGLVLDADAIERQAAAVAAVADAFESAVTDGR
jgi:hypothetical protein